MSEFAALFPKIYFLRSHLVDKESYHLVEIASLSQEPPVLSRDLQSGESDYENFNTASDKKTREGNKIKKEASPTK